MPRRVKGPDGKIHSFPDNATDKQISVALKAIPSVNVPPKSKAPTWADDLGLNQPSDSMVGGFLRGAGAAAVDMAQGAASEIGGMMRHKLQTDQGIDAPQLQTEAPPSMAGFIGTYLPAAAEMMAPGPALVKGGKAAMDLVPRVARAADKFQDVMSAARNVPIDVKDVGDAALRIHQLAERGGSMPLAVRKLLNRMTDPEKAPMVYEEARDFASNISRLSADEFGRLTPALAREVANLRVVLNKANAMAAKQAGKLDEYEAAMREYAAAMRVRSYVDTAIKGAKQNAPWLTAAGAAMWAGKKITNAVTGVAGGGE